MRKLSKKAVLALFHPSLSIACRYFFFHSKASSETEPENGRTLGAQKLMMGCKNTECGRV